MSQVTAKCRLTGHYLFLGVEVDSDDFAKLSDPFMRKFCPFCSCEHAWYKRDAHLVESRRPARRDVLQAS